ncbi:uncharacterized protein LOC135441101, partial [Drosophila montana]|uniref:uncharacterized protein LOC135441101 n=1 Tax=Drosophila montana TaxID=40370 RepID=UPI00313E7DC4
KFCVIALALFGLVAADVSHLQHPGYSYGASASSASFSEGQVALPGGDASSYQPEHLIPQNLKAVNVETASAQIIPGGDSSSYQPEQLIPQHLTAQEESASAQVIPGGDSSSYQPEQLIPQTESFNLGADTQTPEQFIPEADRIAHYNYIQSQGQAAAPAAQVATVSESVNIGADTQTPEQFIPEAERVAHYNYVHSQGKAVLPTPAAAAAAAVQVVPGSDSSSYQPEHLIPQHLKAVHVESGTAAVASESFNLGADTQTPEQFIPEADRIAHATYGQEQQQAPVVIGANSITPAHLYQEPESNGIEEFNAETHVPVVIGRDTITPAHLQAKYSAGASETIYASNGGYIYKRAK